MSDEFRRLQPGVKFRPSATAWNTMLDVAREYRVNHGFSQNGINTSQDGRFWIQNDGVDELPQYSIVGVGEALTLPVDDEGEFLSTMGFGSIEPTTGDRFAIIQDGVESGTIVEARITGLSHCYVNRADTTHMMASAETANYDTLIAAESGQAEIIWMDDVPAAAVGETIHEGTGVPGSGLGSDGDYYKDTAASEYYGPKAAGAWGSAFAYGTGICWAVVVLDQFDTQGITSINGQTGPAVTLQSSGATVTITNPSANVVNLEGADHAVGTNGTNHNIAYTTGLYTHNIPSSSDVNRGLMTPSTQFIGGQKIVIDPLIITSPSVFDNECRIYFSPFSPFGTPVYDNATGGPGSKVGKIAVSGTLAGVWSIFPGTVNLPLAQAYLVADTNPSFLLYGGLGGTDIDTQAINPGVASKPYYAVWEVAVGGATTVRSGVWVVDAGVTYSGGLRTSGSTSIAVSNLATGFVLPPANAGTVFSSENKQGATVDAGMIVATHSSGTGFVLADASSATLPAIGITRASIANTVSGDVQSTGLIVLADWTASTGGVTLAATATYYSDPANPGKMTTTMPTTDGYVIQVIGKAVSTDTMDLAFSDPILL